MEIRTMLENSHLSPFTLPVFKHPTIKNEQRSSDHYSNDNISIPDQLILNHVIQDQDQKKCFVFYGFEMLAKDWQEIVRTYQEKMGKELYIQILKFQGNQKSFVPTSILASKTYAKSQKLLDPIVPGQTISFALTLGEKKAITIYYIPCKASTNEMPSIKLLNLRYFNNKFLQILNEYVTLQNTNTTCYKDQVHQHFENLVYSGQVSSFMIYVKMDQQWGFDDWELCQRFIEKVSTISLTDKHLMDEMDPSNMIQLKKEIKVIYLEENRLRKSLTQQKSMIVQELESILQLLDLKQLYPFKLTFSSITSEMFRKIRNKNVQRTQEWIQQQKIVVNNLQLRIKDLEKVKAELLEKELSAQQTQTIEIQTIRNRIIELEKKIKYQKSEINNKLYEEATKQKQREKMEKNYHDKMKIALSKIPINSISNHNNLHRITFSSIKKEVTGEIKANSLHLSNPKKNPSLSPQKQDKKLEEIIQEMKLQEGKRELKAEMLKVEFAMERQFVRKRELYAKAAEELFNYLIDC